MPSQRTLSSYSYSHPYLYKNPVPSQYKIIDFPPQNRFRFPSELKNLDKNRFLIAKHRTSSRRLRKASKLITTHPYPFPPSIRRYREDQPATSEPPRQSVTSLRSLVCVFPRIPDCTRISGSASACIGTHWHTFPSLSHHSGLFPSVVFSSTCVLPLPHVFIS